MRGPRGSQRHLLLGAGWRPEAGPRPQVQHGNYLNPTLQISNQIEMYLILQYLFLEFPND